MVCQYQNPLKIQHRRQRITVLKVTWKPTASQSPALWLGWPLQLPNKGLSQQHMRQLEDKGCRLLQALRSLQSISLGVGGTLDLWMQRTLLLAVGPSRAVGLTVSGASSTGHCLQNWLTGCSCSEQLPGKLSTDRQH